MEYNITQETFIIVYQKIDELKDIAAFNTWINKIVINLCNRHQSLLSRQSYMDITQMDNEVVEGNIDFLPVELLENKSMQDQVIAEIFKLPDNLRSTIVLYYFEELSISDIAEVLSTPRSTVHRHLIKAQHILCEELERYYDKEFSYNSISKVAILTVLLHQNSKIICSNKIKNAIYKGIKGKLKIGTINITKNISAKIIISLTIVGTLIYGTTLLFQDSNNIPKALAEKNVAEHTIITLETFVGKENAQLIKSWGIKSSAIEGDLLTDIAKNNNVDMQYYYIDPATGIMYVLYQKAIDNKHLLLAEKYNSDTKEWLVGYQIQDIASKIISKEEIKEWFNQFENN